MQAACVRQHARNTVHRVAEKLFLMPDKPIGELMPAAAGDEDLFRGNTPQPKDWLRAWDACRNADSFREAERRYETEAYADGRKSSVKRKCALFVLLPSHLGYRTEPSVIYSP